MARILLAWEFGGGLGHLDILRQAGDRLREGGHAVTAAVRDSERAAGRLGDIPYLPAPVRPPPATGRGGTPTLAHILRNVAFDRADLVDGRLRAWIQLIRATGAECVVADYAPGALTAARHLGLPTVAIGNGFYLPAQDGPLAQLPLLRQQETGTADDAEAEVLAAVNEALHGLAAEPLDTVQSLFRADRHGLFTYPEIDPCRDHRPAEHYWGPVPPAADGAAPDWPVGDGPRAVAYLRPFETLPDLLRACGGLGIRLLAYVVPEAREAAESARYDGLVLSDRPLDLAAVAKDADLAIHHASHGTACTMLEYGVPSLLLPQHQEQLLTAQAVEAMGAGLNAPLKRPRPMAEKLKRLIGEPAFGERARAFAADHPPGSRDPFAQLLEAVDSLV